MMAPATLDIRLPTNMAWMIPLGLFTLVAGLGCLPLGIFWNDLPTMTAGTPSSGFGFIAMGVLFPPMGGACVWFGYRGSATAIRISKLPAGITVEWRSGNRVVRTEHVAYADVVEVVVTDAPSSGTPLYGLVLGMRNGEIMLSNTNSSNLQGHWSQEAQRLAQFLGVPARIPN